MAGKDVINLRSEDSAVGHGLHFNFVFSYPGHKVRRGEYIIYEKSDLWERSRFGNWRQKCTNCAIHARADSGYPCVCWGEGDASPGLHSPPPLLLIPWRPSINYVCINDAIFTALPLRNGNALGSSTSNRVSPPCIKH